MCIPDNDAIDFASDQISPSRLQQVALSQLTQGQRKRHYRKSGTASAVTRTPSATMRLERGRIAFGATTQQFGLVFRQD
jgi:hypothetical protein